MSNSIFTENNNSHTINIDLMNSLEIAQTINNEDMLVAPAVQKTLPEIARAIDLIADSFAKNGRLAYFGAGTSGRLGVLDASECWPTFGIELGMVCGYIAGGERALRFAVEDSEDSTQLGLQDFNHFNPSPQDVIVAISSSGGPQYLLTILKEAHQRRIPTIAISCNPQAPIKAFADIFINPIVGPEVIAGSSRMKAGTAQKMILNMLSTGAMIRIGKTYQNYMIDLRPVNSKLVTRAIGIVSAITHLSPADAADFLRQSHNRVKTACVMALKNCSASQAEKLLQHEHGLLRKVIS